MTATLANQAALLKEYYGPQRVHNLVYSNEPFLGMVPKFTEFYGDIYPIPVIYGTTRGRSATFSTAVTNKGQSASKVFQLTRVADYGLGSIGREYFLASKVESGAFLRKAKAEFDGAIRSVTRSVASALFRNTSGSIGQVGTVSTSSLTLSSIHDVTNFEVGDTIVAADAESTGSLLAGSEVIAAINRDTGVLTSTNTNWTDGITGATLSAGDYLYVQGDRNAKAAGLDSWIPTTAPGATAFYGVDRSVDVTRLGGVRLSGAGYTVEENCINLVSKIAREGGASDKIFLNNVQYRALIKSLGSKVQYEMVQSSDPKAKVGFKGVLIEGDRGPVSVHADHNCKAANMYGLQMNTWKLYSLEEAIDIFDKDSDQKMLREATSDAYEVRAGGYFNLGTEAPGWNGVCHTMDIPSV